MELITTAVVEGVKALTSDVVKDAYGKLKSLILSKFKGNKKVETAVANVEEEPDNKIYKELLGHELDKVGAGEDEELIQQAKALLKLLKEKGVISQTRYQAVLKGDGAIAQGNNAAAAGKGGVAVSGNVGGGVTIGAKDEIK